jgi:hypothetical protein
MSFPPVIFHTIPVARSIPTSNRGDWIAPNAASLALDFPVAVPMPIREEPALAIIARTSAKSTFTSPGTCNSAAMALSTIQGHSELFLLLCLWT